MKVPWKKLLSALVMAAAVVIFYGGLLLFAVLFTSLAGWPPYAQYALWAWAVVSLPLAVIALAGRRWLPRRAKRWLGFGTLGVLALCLAWCGFGAWRDSIPTVDDDRADLLREYEPFGEDTKAVWLEEPSALRLDPQEARNLTLNGATALYPIYTAFVQAVYPNAGEGGYTPRELYEIVRCDGTITAYERLLDGTTDIAFAAAPSQAQLEAAAEAGMEYHLTPIGREAFVFFVNSRNPVTELTVDEIQGIYTGEITNWREVGGEDQSIRPFQRAEDSGSQSALERLMDGLPLVEPELEDRLLLPLLRHGDGGERGHPPAGPGWGGAHPGDHPERDVSHHGDLLCRHRRPRRGTTAPGAGSNCGGFPGLDPVGPGPAAHRANGLCGPEMRSCQSRPAVVC